MNPEQQHQQRRHQRPAADAGEADKDADEEPERVYARDTTIASIHWVKRLKSERSGIGCKHCRTRLVTLGDVPFRIGQ